MTEGTESAVHSSSPRLLGPVEGALRTAIRADTSLAFRAGIPDLDVEFMANSSIGPFRFDLRPLIGEQALQADITAAIATELKALPFVQDAIGVPPRIYLKVPIPVLYSWVVDAFGDPSGTVAATQYAFPGTVFVAFSDPNINKPLHLGHLRNNFLGMALAALLAGTRHSVERHCIHTDWGIHICQALLAYLKWGNGETPQSVGIKGDHFVGSYYVRFHAEKQQVQEGGDNPPRTVLEQEAADILQRLTNGDAALRRVHDRFVGWADAGIQETYRRIGTRFDAIYYESDHLDRCSAMLDQAVGRGNCSVRPDGSAFIELSDAGFGEITLRRQDGTPVVYSQWMAVDIERFAAREFNALLVLLGSEWESGYSILLEALERFGEDWVGRVVPIYYGMVTLPEGRMKSRYGTGLSADGVLDRVRDRLLSDYLQCDDRARAGDVADRLAVSLLKYHFLNARRKKNFLYSEDALWNQTLPRFSAVLGWRGVQAERSGADAAGEPQLAHAVGSREGGALLRALLKLNEFPRAVDHAVTSRDPSVLVRFLDGLTATATVCQRVVPPGDPFFGAVSRVLARGLQLLNVDVPPPPWTLRLSGALAGHRLAGNRKRNRDVRTLV